MNNNLLATRGTIFVPWVTLGVATVCICLHVVFGATPDLLVYDRARILDGQIWRLMTGHLVNWTHNTWPTTSAHG